MQGPSLPLTKRARAPEGGPRADVYPPSWNLARAARAACLQDATSAPPSPSFHVAVTLRRAPRGPRDGPRPPTSHALWGWPGRSAELALCTGRVWERGRGAEGPRSCRRQPSARGGSPPDGRRPSGLATGTSAGPGGRRLSPTPCADPSPRSPVGTTDTLAGQGRGAGGHGHGGRLVVWPPGPSPDRRPL